MLLISLFHPELVRGGAQQVCYELFEGLREQPDIEPFLLASIDAELPRALQERRAHHRLRRPAQRIPVPVGRLRPSLAQDRLDRCMSRRSSSSSRRSVPTSCISIISCTLGIDLLTLTRRVLPECRIVFTFHEFMAICDAHGHMVRTKDKSLCSQASPRALPPMLSGALAGAFPDAQDVDHAASGGRPCLTCPSRFMIEHYVDWGLPRDKIHHVTNGQRNYGAEHARGRRRPAPSNRFGFFGQLVDDKGVHVLLRAVGLLRAEGFADFSVRAQWRQSALRQRGRARGDRGVPRRRSRSCRRRSGSCSPTAPTRSISCAARMARVDWCLVPSIWWEIFGLVISEAWMFGKPVICSNVGGPAERIRHEVDGLHFEMGDARALARTIRRACTEEGLWERLAAALPEPPRRETMVAGYRAVYGNLFAWWRGNSARRM